MKPHGISREIPLYNCSKWLKTECDWWKNDKRNKYPRILYISNQNNKGDYKYIFSDKRIFTDDANKFIVVACCFAVWTGKENQWQKIFPGKYSDLEKKLGFSPLIFQPIKSCNSKKTVYYYKTIYAYINKFRNGIAHQNLSVSVDENKEIRITIFNVYNKNCKNCKSKNCINKGLNYSPKGIVDFKITVTVKQLQKIALYIADSYLKAISWI